MEIIIINFEHTIHARHFAHRARTNNPTYIHALHIDKNSPLPCRRRRRSRNNRSFAQNIIK